MRKIMTLFLLCCLAFSAFAGGDQEAAPAATRADTGPLEKYDPPITVSVWRSTNNRQYLEGESLTDNIWTRAIEDELGVVFEYVWIAPNNERDAKINTSLAAGDLPDVLTKLNLEQYYNLARVNRLAPQGELIEQYDVGEVTKYLDFGPGVTRRVLTINDEIYGWGRGPELANVKPFAVRGDWLAATGRSEPPDEIDDIIDLLYDLSEEDPDGDGRDNTYGLAASAAFLAGSVPLEAFFATYESYPDIWVEQNGELVYGSLLPETKDALESLKQLHADGVLSPEWPVLNPWSETPDELAQDKVGAVFGQQWIHNWAGVEQTVANYPGMEWQHVIPKTADGEYIRYPMTAQVRDIAAVNSDFEHPEVLVKLFNLYHKLTRDPETADGKYHTIETGEGAIGSHFYWTDFFVRVDIDTNPVLARQVTEALADEDPSALNPEAMIYYDAATEYLQSGRQQLNPADSAYGSYRTFGPGGVNSDLAWTMIDNELYQIDAFQGAPTPSQASFAGDLRSTRNELFVQMIVGELDVDAGWEQWQTYWRANGGSDWAEEVNEWYEAQ